VSMSLKSKWSLKSIESRSSITISVALLLLLLAVVDRELIGCAVANVLGARVGEADEELEIGMHAIHSMLGVRLVVVVVVVVVAVFVSVSVVYHQMHQYHRIWL
jgi:uncharacterized membrane protein YidH (DUF202 family)